MTIGFIGGGMPGVGELLVVAVIIIVLFGAKKLPQLARSLGSSLSAFKKGRQEGLADLEGMLRDEPNDARTGDTKDEKKA